MTRSTLSQAATLLAFVAVVLHVVGSGLGGRLCVRTTPPPDSSGCPSLCCEEEQAAVVRVSTIEFLAVGDQARPVESDCCLEIASNFLARGADQLDLRGAGALTSSFVAPDLDRALLASRRVRGPEAPGALRGPPSSFVRTTVLRL